jgi:hypothetical protein
MDPHLVNADECLSVWRKTVHVNWEVAPSQFHQSQRDEPPMVISYRYPKEYRRQAERPMTSPKDWREPDPNQIIWEHLKEWKTSQQHAGGYAR